VKRTVVAHACRSCHREIYYRGEMDALYVWSKQHIFDYSFFYQYRNDIKACGEPLSFAHRRMEHGYRFSKRGFVQKPPCLESVVRPAYYDFVRLLEPSPDSDFDCEKCGDKMQVVVVDCVSLGVKRAAFNVEAPELTAVQPGGPRQGLKYKHMVLVNDPTVGAFVRRLGGGSVRAKNGNRSGAQAEAGFEGEMHGTKARKQASKPLSVAEFALLLARVDDGATATEWLKPLLEYLRDHHLATIPAPADAAAAGARAGAAVVGAAARNRGFAVGTVVRKFFNGFGTFRGKITKYFRREKIYTVVYDDGDKEDYSADEIAALLRQDLTGNAAAAAAGGSSEGGEATVVLVSRDYRLLLRALGAKGQLYTGTQGCSGDLGELLTRMSDPDYVFSQEDGKPLMYHCPILAKVSICVLALVVLVFPLLLTCTM
jgi:hypothetical protein